jgi:hypothetical protein
MIFLVSSLIPPFLGVLLNGEFGNTGKMRRKRPPRGRTRTWRELRKSKRMWGLVRRRGREREWRGSRERGTRTTRRRKREDNTRTVSESERG